MRLNNYEINLPSYSIGKNIYNQIESICSPYGTKVVVIGGKRAMDAAKQKLEQAVAKTNITIIDYLVYGTDCTYRAVKKLREKEAYQTADMVFAVGGGKAMDTCKLLCIEEEKPLFTFPTIASNCAACTTVSIMYQEDGTFLKPHFFTRPANHTFIDTEIIANAPAEYMWAGIGDTYAKYYEAAISSRNEVLEHYTALGVNISRMCLEPMFYYAVQGLEDNRRKHCSNELEQTVLAIVVTTALASIFLTRDFTPDYNSGLAHAVFYALTKYPVIEREHLHGEVVAFGVLIALLCDGQREEFERIYQLNRALGLPIKLSDIGITKEEFAETMQQIPHMSDVRHYPYVITQEMLEEAMQVLEEKKYRVA